MISVSPWLVGAVAVLLSGCASPHELARKREQRADAAQALFEQTVDRYHLPGVTAKGAERDQLLARAAADYSRLLRVYPDQRSLCAQALRGIATVRAEQGHLDDAVRIYYQVGQHYAELGWEVLQAWNSAGDLLWKTGRQTEAHAFYALIVQRFDHPSFPATFQTIVRHANSRLAPTEP